MKSHTRLWLVLVSGALVASSACKPTPRTANQPKLPESTSEQQAGTEKAASSSAADSPDTPQNTDSRKVGLLYVEAVRQGFDILRPWEKEKAAKKHAMGVYLGNGRVLTLNDTVQDATYIELSLPDQSRRVPAKVLKSDSGLSLALLGVQHEKDIDIFDNVTAHELGSPLRVGSKAQVFTLVNRVIPVQAPLVVESVDDDWPLPRLSMRAVEGALPQGIENGLPVLKDDRVVGLVTNRSDRALVALNAELLHRFLMEREGGTAVPDLGVRFAQLDDPVFVKFLKMKPGSGGLYVSKILPHSAAATAGLREGDVLTSIDGLPLDPLGRCNHPIYGLLDAEEVLRSLKPNGEQIKLGVSREGKQSEVVVELNRDAVEKGPIAEEKAGQAPRYILWGGLLFQPFSATYRETLRDRSNGLPITFLRMEDRIPELIEQKKRDVVALTLIIPTPATLGYETLGFCIVEKVNGHPVQSFSQFADLLDAPTADGIVEFSINRPPYTIYVDRNTAESCNETLRRRAIPQLRRLNEQTTP